jgi:CHAT domain-containing protein
MSNYLKPQLVSAKQSYLGIMKLEHMCDFYLNQYNLRGFPRTRILVETCLQHSNGLIDLLPLSEKEEWEGVVIRLRARLAFVGAQRHRVPNPQVLADFLDGGELLKAIELYEGALSIFERAGNGPRVASVRGQLATCCQQLWYLSDKAPDSPHFGRATNHFRAAGEILRSEGNAVDLRLNRGFLLRHLYSGYVAKVHHDHATIHEQAVEALRDAEKLIDNQRQELSALEPREAILAKQHMRRDSLVHGVFETAPVLFGLAGNCKVLWDWIQRSKARSVSDLLGLGFNIPSDLREMIDKDRSAEDMLTAEGELARKVQGPDKFVARKALEAHQRKMRGNRHLSEVLDFREGKPVTWARLAGIRGTSSWRTWFVGWSSWIYATWTKLGGIEGTVPASARRTWFVDWVSWKDMIFLVMTSDKKEEYHVFFPDVTITEAKAWISTYLEGQARPLDDGVSTSFAALFELTRLVAPIVETASEGDLLVLCPTEPLHRIPLHAAVVEGNPGDNPQKLRTLIERNPIVYTPSMTVYQQNMAKFRDRTTNGHEDSIPKAIRGTVLGVYEDDNGECWEGERDIIYAVCGEIAGRLGWGEATCGNDVDRDVFKTACKTEVVHFFGHFTSKANNVLQHGIALGRNQARDSSSQSIGEAPDAADQDRVFTVSDSFASRVTASHFTLVACGSGREAIQTGDEPLGMVTGLLYAGASSVAGTLWEVDSSAGKSFTRMFYRAFEGAARRDVIDLAVQMQETVKYLRRDSDTMLPYSWAGFVLHGIWCFRAG